MEFHITVFNLPLYTLRFWLSVEELEQVLRKSNCVKDGYRSEVILFTVWSLLGRAGIRALAPHLAHGDLRSWLEQLTLLVIAFLYRASVV